MSKGERFHIIEKALVTGDGVRPQTNWGGQIPRRNPSVQGMRLDPELRASLEEAPPKWSLERFHDKPIVKALDTVSGLGLTSTQEETLARIVRHETNAASNVLQLRKALMSKFLTERFPPEIRQVITSRAVQLFVNDLQKSGEPEIYTVDDLLQKAESPGGTYYRRVKGPNGKYRYFYSKDDYDKHSGAHADGGEQRSKFIRGGICAQLDKAGEGGCDATAFQKLAKRFGPRAVYDAAQSLKSEGKLFYKGKKFYSAEPKAAGGSGKSSTGDGGSSRSMDAGQDQKERSPQEQTASTTHHLLKETKVTKEYAGPGDSKAGPGGSRPPGDSKKKIQKAAERFHITLDHVLEKGGLPAGTIRDWKGGRYQKQPNGDWKPIAKKREQGQQQQQERSKPAPKPDTDEYFALPWREEPLPGHIPAAPPDREDVGERGGTEEMHWDSAKGDYTESRKRLHNEIVRSFFKGKTPAPEGEKVAIVMMGGTASGKSTMLRKSGAGGENFVHVDADDVKESLPEYEAARAVKYRGAAAMAHNESSMVAKQAASQAIDGGYNVVLDGTGANGPKFLKQIARLKEAGYHVHLMMPDQDKDQAMQDAMSRASRTGRYVPPKFIGMAYDRIPGNFFNAARAADSAQLYDRRQDSKLVWEKTREDERAHDPKFLANYPNYQQGAKAA